MADKKLSTLLEILNYSSTLLKENGIEEARLNAELMLADVLNCRRLDLYLDFDKPLISEEKEKFKVYLRRRLKREPLQYILGKTNFFGYDIFVDDSVLIPRQETEILVEKVLNSIVLSEKDFVNIAEIGIGSGCIAVALLSELKKRKIGYNYTGMDISDKALEVARKNSSFHKLSNISFIKSDFLRDDFELENEIDYVISNPPYVSYDEYLVLEPEVTNNEPKDAITDSSDGFVFYEKFVKLYLRNKANYFLEIAYNGKERIEYLLNDNGINNYQFVKDYNNNYRVLIILK